MIQIERLAKEEQDMLPASVRILYDFYFRVIKGEKNERTSNNIAAEKS